METNDPRIGLDFGDYKIMRKLAQGGMGAVYIAEHEGMYKIVKFILGEAVRHPAIRERFKGECKALDPPTDPVAVAHFNEGNAHYKVRDFEKAVEEYKAGELVQAAARFDYNLGQCYRLLGKYEDATWHYERYVHSGFATAEDIEQINKWISEMKAETEQRARSAPPTEPATLQPRPARTPGIDAWYQDYFGWVLAGAGFVVGGVGVGLDANASSLRDDANRTSNQQQQVSLRNTADSRELAGTILAIGGGAILVTGIVKLAIHDHEPSMPSAVSIALSPSGVFVFGRF